MVGHVQYISQRLSLRKPQKEALEGLSAFLNRVPLPVTNTIDLKDLEDTFPQLKDFERDFPNLCFSLATGVGKTRLMGALLTYLYLEKRIRNFLIIAPNNTILEKLEKDFSDVNHPKYVFQGILEFKNKKPVIITGDNFERGVGVKQDGQGDEQVYINIFSIAKIHTKDRRIKQPSDYIAEKSYFDYLRSLKDLVILMDEAHRYRAKAAMNTLQELNPLLGMEFTATPQIEKSKTTTRFKNIIYDYPLSQALKDEFLKEPAVAGRENFNPDNFASSQELDRIKIQDAISIHEMTKSKLKEYTTLKRVEPVKPLMLIVAQDTKHADALQEMIKENTFFNGRYKDKVLVVHSELKTEAEEKMVRNLLQVESYSNPIEIVIHVNMLREGWDIMNLFTMVPLRRANSKTLIEQNLGRGLRLPFGKRTGISEIDTHTVVSHDRFNEIIDAAHLETSVIRKGIVIEKDVPQEPITLLTVTSTEKLGIDRLDEGKERQLRASTHHAFHDTGLQTTDDVLEHLTSKRDRQGCIDPTQIKNAFDQHRKDIILIPHITILPSHTRQTNFKTFQLELSSITKKPLDNRILITELRTENTKTYEALPSIALEKSPEEQLVEFILDSDAVADNENSQDVAFDCAKQMVQYFRNSLNAEKKIECLIRQHGRHLSQIILHQMLEHSEGPVIKWEGKVKEGFFPLKDQLIPAPKEGHFRHYSRSVDKLKIREMVFEGFQKSLYSLVKFDSDSERVLAVILEKDSIVQKWLKLQRGTFSLINYMPDDRHPNCRNYEPDFIIETKTKKFLCEVKRYSEIKADVVTAKADAASYWCYLANQYSQTPQIQPWSYLLIPHDILKLSMTVDGLAEQFTRPYRASEGCIS